MKQTRKRFLQKSVTLLTILLMPCSQFLANVPASPQLFTADTKHPKDCSTAEYLFD